jgi:hypothetical protein
MRTFWYVAYAEVVVCCWVLGIFGSVSLVRASRRRKSAGPEAERGVRSPLALRFGQRFESYKSRVAAYIPGVR